MVATPPSSAHVATPAAARASARRRACAFLSVIGLVGGVGLPVGAATAPDRRTPVSSAEPQAAPAIQLPAMTRDVPGATRAHVSGTPNAVPGVGGRGASGGLMSGGTDTARAAIAGDGTAHPGDLPATALRAYRTAEARLAASMPACRLSWSLLAGIGRVESWHGRYAGAVLHPDGTSTPRIFGLPLDGRPGLARILDTDRGAVDRDRVYDRAVGPMQFLPGTWASVAADGDGDGQRDVHDLDDAATGAGAYLCAGEEDLSSRAGQTRAVYRYNHSERYVSVVLGLAAAYESGISAPALPDVRSGPEVGPAPKAPASMTRVVRRDRARDGHPGRRTSAPDPAPSPQPTRSATTPTPRPTETSGGRPSPTASATPTATSSSTPSPTSSPSPTPTATSSSTPSPTSSPSPTPTATSSSTPSPTSSPSPTPTATPTPSCPAPKPSGTATPAPTPSGTGTPKPSPTATPTSTSTSTPTASTPTPTATATATPTPSATSTPTPEPTC